MKQIFFAGNHIGNSGPREVNKGYVKYLQDRVLYLKQKQRSFLFIEMIIKLFISKVVIFSGVSSVDHILLVLCKLFNNRIIYIMHGWLKYEDEKNRVKNSRGEKNEALLLKAAHQIMCVSKPFCELIQKEYPHLSSKIDYITNGIDWKILSYQEKKTSIDDKRIILIGGGRITKRNIEVCKAVKLINERSGLSFHIDVYGIYEKDDDSAEIASMPYTIFHPIIPHEEILDVFATSFLFVQNSDFEPFSLGVVEALSCGCNILISTNVGAADIIPGLTNNDIITDTSDVEQIAEKIYLLYHSQNSVRLYESIDKNKTSTETAAKKLFCAATQLL